MEGGGFPVRRPIPNSEMDQIDPFLLLDHLGPTEWGPREAIGAPDHPHEDGVVATRPDGGPVLRNIRP